jgi:uncharacterized protein YdhG (YjbR/CyaY superfamily)
MKAAKGLNPAEEGVRQVEAYFAALTEPHKSTLATLRERIRAVASADAVEGFSYGVPAFKGKLGAIGGYSAYKEFCSYYPMSGRVITKHKDDLAGYVTSKGAIRFPADKPLSAALVKKLVRSRLEEIEAKLLLKKIAEQ